MTPNNYEDFMKSLSDNKTSILSKDYSTKPGYNELYKLVVIKDLIAEYIWYVMAGFLTISISSHSISNIQCEFSTEEMKKNCHGLTRPRRRASCKSKETKSI